MKWVIWIGTEKNPKAQKHKDYDVESEADKIVEYLNRIFGGYGIVVTKEIVNETAR